MNLSVNCGAYNNLVLSNLIHNLSSPFPPFSPLYNNKLETLKEQIWKNRFIMRLKCMRKLLKKKSKKQFFVNFPRKVDKSITDYLFYQKPFRYSVS